MTASLFQRVTGAAVVALSLLTVGGALAADALPKLSIDSKAISVSGLSSGAYMTMQMHVAHSATFMGAGVVAGGPYYCAAGAISYTSICMGQVPGMPPNASLMYSAAQGFAADGNIDSLDNLKSSKVYLFTGTRDSVVGQSAVSAAKDFYELAGLPAASIQYVDDVPAQHAFITPNAANDCAYKGSPYINKCTVDGKSYDQAGILLQQIYGPLNGPAATATGSLLTFDQKQYGASAPLSSMSDDGHLYVPKDCAAAGANCRLHVSIHGCGQDQSQIGDKWYTLLNLNNWADTNKIVVLYPQVKASNASPSNPAGCWDWWGYTSPSANPLSMFNLPTYAQKAGVQISAIKAMVDAVSKP